MAFLDFIKNRGGQEQTTDAQHRPETAKEMYRREATQEQASVKPAQSLGADSQAKIAEAKELFRQGTEQAGNVAPANAPATPEGSASPQPMRQMSMNQETVAPALSPTSAQAGSPSTEHEAPAPQKTPEQAKPTMARATPSWER